MNQKESNNNIKIDKILLEEDLRCPICKILYDSNIHIPFIIGCGHTFCKQCVFNNSNNNCPIDSNIDSFKLYIRNIQLENIVNKILIRNKEIQNQQKMIYIKPDMKSNKILNNNNIEDNIVIDQKEKTTRTRGKSINQRGRKNDYNINSPESGLKNYNKHMVMKHFKSPNLNSFKNGNKFNDIINYEIIEENENKLNFIEDNFKFEEEKIDDMQITETIGTIPVYDEKSLTNSIREDFNDLLTKNEIYKKRIINNRNSNNNFVSPIKKKSNLDINENFFNEQNKKIILFEEKDFLTQKPLRLSNYNLKYQQYSNENRQMTEGNQVNNIKTINSNYNNNKTEKKKENKKYQNFNTASLNKPYNQNIRNNPNVNDANNKNMKTIFDYIKSINKLSSSNNNNVNTLNKNNSKNKEDFFEDSPNNTNKATNNNNGANIININNYNNNLRISLQEKPLGENEFNLLKNNLINSPINSKKYIKVRASSKIPKKKEMIKNNGDLMNNENEMKDVSLNNNNNNKKLKQIKVKKESNNNINNINLYTENNTKTNSNNNSDNSSLLYNKKKINLNNNIENNNSNISSENIDVKTDKNEMNKLSIRQTVVKNRNIISNINNINITISPNKNRNLTDNRIPNQKLDFSKTLNKSPLNRLNNNNEKEINNIIKVGEFLSKNKIEKSRSLSSNKNKSFSTNTKNIISKLKKQYDSLKFPNISPTTKKKYDEFFQNSLNTKIISELITKASNDSQNIISIILTPNNNLFIGEMDSQNFSNPKKGIMFSPNMDYFEGEFLSGKKEGKGKLIYNNGTEYIGNFKNNKPDGYGQLTQENGEIYQGEWKEGKINGHGTRFHKNGDKYIGNYVDNVRNGYGVYIFSNGNTYEGNWVKGKANGKGIFKYNNGNEYEGEFKNNLIEGKGKLVLKNGDVYEGMFVNGTIHGEGSYINTEGEKYVGEFKKGKKDGKGKLVDMKGNVIQEGFWKQDEFLFN